MNPLTFVCSRPGCSKPRPSNRRYCSDACLDVVRQERAARYATEGVKAHESKRRSAKVVEQVRLEERLIHGVEAFLKAHPSRTHRLGPTKHSKVKATSHEFVLLVSDAHYPEVVDPTVAMGLEYNADICVRRLEHIRNAAIRYKELRETSYPIQKLTVAVLGDMISGDIHEELEVTNQYPTPEALVKLAYYLHDMFLSLAAEFPAVEVIFIPGNHPRTKQIPRFKQKTVLNFEYILGHFVAALAQGSYVVQVPRDMVYIHTVFNWRIGMTHGDGVKSNSFGGVPWYGLKQRQDAIQSLMRHLGLSGLDYLTMGHFHRPAVLEGTDMTLIMNGAIKGGDEYSIGTRLSSTNPVQLLLTFHEAHGLTDVSRINLKDVL